MKSICRPHASAMLLLVASMTQLFFSCETPLKWNADVKKFVDDGVSIIKLSGFTAMIGSEKKTVIPSGKEAIVNLDVANPRAIELACAVRCADESLFDSLPSVTIPNRTKIVFSFTPSTRAERKDLVFTVQLSSPEIENTFPPEPLTLHCNTPPLSVEPSLDAALDPSGCAFAAFKLPSSATDDDIAQVRITYAHAESIDQKATATFAVDEACLCSRVMSVAGIDLLGTSDPLNRYFKPSSLEPGENYVFTVVLIDTEGLESEAAEISSDATLYSVTYDGNGKSGGSTPIDPQTYRQTKPVTVLGQGTLVRTGYTFAGWNDAADGSGKAYTPLSVFKMGPGNLRLYAVWVHEEKVDSSFTLNPAYGTITFTPASVTVQRSKKLVIDGSISSGTTAGWLWYVDGVCESGQTGPSFSWDTDGKNVGEYIISAAVVYTDPLFKKDYTCTGWIKVTVTY